MPRLPPLPIVRAHLARRAPLVVRAAALVLLSARVYLASSERDLLDPQYTLLSSEALLLTGSLDLAPYLPHLARDAPPEASRGAQSSGSK